MYVSPYVHYVFESTYMLQNRYSSLKKVDRRQGGSPSRSYLPCRTSTHKDLTATQYQQYLCIQTLLSEVILIYTGFTRYSIVTPSSLAPPFFFSSYVIALSTLFQDKVGPENLCPEDGLHLELQRDVMVEMLSSLS